MCILDGLGKYMEQVPVQWRLCILEAGGPVEKMQMESMWNVSVRSVSGCI